MTPQETKAKEEYLIKIVRAVYNYLDITPSESEIGDLVMSELINIKK